MAMFAPRKSRRPRTVVLRPTSRMGAWLDGTLRNRETLPRILVCGAALLLLLVAVEGWRAAFPYRVGDRADQGIAARVAFQRINRFKTESIKNAAEAQVPYVFLHDPEPLDHLAARLRTHLGHIAQAQTLDELPRETQLAFGLMRLEPAEAGGIPAAEGPEPGTAQRPRPDDAHDDFAILKVAVSTEDDTAGRRIDELIGEFEKFIAPIQVRGLAAPEEIRRNNIPPEAALAVVPLSNRQSRRIVPPAEVVLDDLLNDTGLLGKVWSAYPELNLIRPMLHRWLLSQAPVTLRYEDATTKNERRAARQRIDALLERHSRDGLLIEPEDGALDDRDLAVLRAVADPYNQGTLLVEPGQKIDEEALGVLRAEYNALELLVPTSQRVARLVTILLMLLVLAVLNGYYIVRNEPRLMASLRRLGVYLGAVLLAVALGRILSPDPWRAEIVPLLAAVMVFAIAYNQVFAVLTALTLSLLVTLSTQASLGQFVVLMSVASTSVILLSRVPTRTTLIKVGFWAGAVYFVVSWGMGIVGSQSFLDVWADADLLAHGLRGAGWCLLTGFLVAGSLPFIESAFGVVTDISLLEMSDVSHPLLQELVRRAPGTYNHSMAVASLGETAADRIGANGLLVRVGAYFHDIGKMLKPHYFIENTAKGAESRHEHLAPAMSTLIIIGHVKDGVDLARQYDLPQPIVDFIEQHHGTTLVEYFYNEAARQADLDPDHRTDAEESRFRYPGPKPQSREAGVMMLADAVESASRSLSDPTPRRIESLVHSITMKRLLDGQFDESSLTLSEIHEIEDSLVKSLIGMYHGRIQYPEQRSA